jgi:hypothetical protein
MSLHEHPNQDQIAIGYPLPFPVYDRDGHLLLRSGFVIETEKQFELLSENGLFKDEKRRIPLVAVKPFRDYATPEPTPTEPARGNRHDLTFESLDVAIGARLQVERVGDERRYTSALIGYIPKVSVIIRTPSSDGGIVLFREGESVIVRAFSGTSAFAFTAIIIGVRYTPETYLHLKYPKHVEGAAVRQQKRVEVGLIATATRRTEGVVHEGVASRVLDLSVGGAQLQTKVTLGSPGDRLEVGFRLPTPEGDATLALEAEIRSSSLDAEGRYCHGVRFLVLEPMQSLALRGYVAKPHR